jgi:aconitate hydratase
MAKVFSPDLAFDPIHDTLTTPSGEEFRFQPPTGDALPSRGYKGSDQAYVPPPADDSERSKLDVSISAQSQRLQKLSPFPPWNGRDLEDCLILIKTTGKCTTDHITPAGPWFRFRGHLENISNNTLIGAVNAETGNVNKVRNQLSQQDGNVPGTARYYQSQGRPWVVVADHNYGEGSSREHAALQPRYLGGVAIIAKSFARIHEANLKKQGMLAVTFAEEADYDRIRASDRISIMDLTAFAPGKPLTMRIQTDSGEDWEAPLMHTFTQEQIEYFKAGSALNVMAKRRNEA